MPDIWVATAEGVLRSDDVELTDRSIAALEPRGDTWWAIVDDHEPCVWPARVAAALRFSQKRSFSERI